MSARDRWSARSKLLFVAAGTLITLAGPLSAARALDVDAGAAWLEAGAFPRLARDDRAGEQSATDAAVIGDDGSVVGDAAASTTRAELATQAAPSLGSDGQPASAGDAAVAQIDLSYPGQPSISAGGPVPSVEEPLDVTVRGQSKVDRLRESAEAVTVLETTRAKRESADMGDVLARTQGVGVRRTGGLGSDTRFSLAGLVDDQVRFFLDGVPLELAGYPFGIANVPVNLIEQIEVYSGAVPIRFGADALGGAVNLVTDRNVNGTRVAGSYQAGSFDTHRLTLDGRHLHRPTGFFTRVSGFLDSARNDYPIDVEAADSQGRTSPARAYRFHDGYRATGGNAEFGFVKRPWAKRLLLRTFVTDYDKDIQHNFVMTIPYGGVTYGETAAGATLRYQQDFGLGVSVDALAGYTYTRANFVDVATCVYDWFGRCVQERRKPGEADTNPHDQLNWDKSGFARVNVTWRLHPDGALRLAVAPTYLTRTGDERREANPSERDPLSAERNLFTLVNGLEYELDLLEERLQNIVSLKEYVQVLGSEEPAPGGIFRRRDRNTHRFGLGDALRYRFTDWLYAKASYEWATRLPRPDEVFGDNLFVIGNLELRPESSHNLNVGATLAVSGVRSGAFRAVLGGFLRDASKLLVLLPVGTRVQRYENVRDARSLGVEAMAGWTSRGEYVVLDGNVTYQDFRNTSHGGAYEGQVGDRIPNRPYLFANGMARLQFRDVVAERDEIALSWDTRYVHEFFRSWESIGQLEYKLVVPAQVVHGAGISYLVRRDSTQVSTSLEVHNLSDERVFDFFGVQRPGRAFYAKVTLDH